MKKILIFIVLAAFTLVSGLYLERYVDVSPEILNGELSVDGALGWEIRGAGNVVSINDNKVKLGGPAHLQSVAISQRLDHFSDSSFLRLSADLASDAAKGDSGNRSVGILSVAQYGATDVWRMARHVAGQIKGKTARQSYAVVFTPVNGESFLKVVLKLYRGGGVLYAWNVSLKEVQQAWWYRYLQVFCLGSWALFFGRCIFPTYWERSKGLGGVGLALLMIVIIAGTSFPGSMKKVMDTGINRNLSRVERVCNRIVAKVGGEWRLPVTAIRRQLPNKSAVAHFILFTGLAFALVVSLPTGSLAGAGVDILMLAAGSELIQFYVDGRTPYWADFGIDLCGVTTGLLLAGFYVLVRSRVRQKKQQGTLC